MLVAGLCMIVLSALPSGAATIDIQTTNIDGQPVSFLTVEGDLEAGDEIRFADLAIRLSAGAVLFNSRGGDVNAGIEIGRAIRLKGFVTMAVEPYACASACALAWLGGMTRFMGGDDAIGFHAVYLASDPRRQADSVGNALVGAYLNQIGMTPQAIAYITEVQPHDIRWMSFADAQRIGISVLPLDPPDETAEQPHHDQPMSPQDWSSYGEWIQIFSRQSYREAVDLAGAFRREFPQTFVFRYDNGWYVGVIGPFPSGEARTVTDRLVRARRIPSDSFVIRGERLAAPVWGGVPEKPDAVTGSPNEALALAAAEEYFAATSKSRVETMTYLSSMYPQQVEYFGKLTPRAAVLKEKSEFVARWPQRRYTLRAGAEATCRPDGHCVVDGLVDWNHYSAPRRATSTGTARFTLTFVRRGGGVTLVSETSTVLRRAVRQR